MYVCAFYQPRVLRGYVRVKGVCVLSSSRVVENGSSRLRLAPLFIN